MDLTTPSGTREFLLLCLDGRKKRTAAQLVKVLELQPTFADAVDVHAPDLAMLRRQVEEARTAEAKAKGAADRAEKVYATALESWIRTPAVGGAQ
ncbi:hypothetical protein ACFYUY_01565 [Kitasatospora sp. NPDC004745]|uniref:hypothetical protein n=1 Tax=Kitasatospora sp. NPDC004745 TaxID=3364019 RepID=UPI0036C39707